MKTFLQTGQVKAALFPSQSSSGRIEFRSIFPTAMAIPLDRLRLCSAPETRHFFEERLTFFASVL